MSSFVMSSLVMTGLVILGACTTMNAAEAQNIVLLKAKIKSVKEAPDQRREPGEVDLSMWFRVQLAMVEPLIGHLGSTHVEVELKIATLPTGDLKNIYVLGKQLPDGSLQALQWDYVSSGLCIQHDLAMSYRIDNEIQRLRQTGRVKWNADCNW
jgi:hypothetical protein